LAGPYLGFQAFSVIGNGNTTYYVIIDALNIAWEVGIGTYTSAGNTLARTTVLASSNAGSLVNLGAGPKDVILTQPARRSVLVQEGGSGLLTGTTAFTANGVPYANSSSTLTTGPALTFNGTNLGIGTSTPTTLLNLYSATSASVLVSGDGATSLVVSRASSDISAPTVNFRKYRGTIAAPLATNTGDFLGNSNYTGYDGTTLIVAATITGVAESVSGTGNMAGALTFGTRPAGVGTSNTERMRIDSAGNVGIGTSSISGGGGGTILNVSGATAASFRVSNSISGDALDAFITGGIGYLQTATAIPLVFRTNAAERMRIDSAGNVGIGTSSPNASAILDAQSTTKGVRMPNMTTTQKNAIASPAAGLMVFDTTLAKLCVYTGAAWETITST
jgi:hypothetical protein